MPDKFLFRAAAVCGFAGFVLSLAADSILPSPSPGTGLGQISGAVLSLLAIAAGSPGGRRFLWNDLPVILMNTIVLVLVLDSAAFLVSRRMASRPPQAEPGMADPEEAVFHPPPSCYCPYVLLRLQPGYSAPGVHTDGEGFRITPGASAEEGATSVHVYGGSTAYGWFLDDSSTITSFLQRSLADGLAAPVRVCNRAAATRNSTHSMLEFILALQAGDIPDAAVFYQGYNEAATTWYEAEPGAIMGLRRMRELLGPERAYREPGWPVAENISLVRLGLSLIPKDSEAPELIESIPLSRGMDIDALARGTIEVFLSNERQIRAAADAFGVEVLVLWQPALAGEIRPLFPYEREYLATMDQDQVEFQRRVWALARESFQGGDAWIGDATAGADSSVYDDYCHMNVYGNSLVAGAIAERLLPLLKEGE